METEAMGRVLVTAKIENMGDLYEVARRGMDPNRVRSVEVSDALVDTGATMLCLPKHLIDKLGLSPFRTRRIRTSAGNVVCNLYDAVRLTIQGRECTQDVVEVPDDCPVLIGQLALEALDFVIDPKARKLIGNPEHGGVWTVEIL
jgi:clan AA aspartic protease